MCGYLSICDDVDYKNNEDTVKTDNIRTSFIDFSRLGFHNHQKDSMTQSSHVCPLDPHFSPNFPIPGTNSVTAQNVVCIGMAWELVKRKNLRGILVLLTPSLH